LRSYQSVLILKPDLDEGQVDQALEKINSFYLKNDGETLKVDKWGKKRLAYKVRKNKFGYYLNIYHKIDPAKTRELEKDYQLFDLIIKYLVIRLEEKDIDRVMAEKVEETADAGSSTEDEAKAADAPAPASTD